MCSGSMLRPQENRVESFDSSSYKRRLGKAREISIEDKRLLRS